MYRSEAAEPIETLMLARAGFEAATEAAGVEIVVLPAAVAGGWLAVPPQATASTTAQSANASERPTIIITLPMRARCVASSARTSPPRPGAPRPAPAPAA